jgi:hypothetical protein
MFETMHEFQGKDLSFISWLLGEFSAVPKMAQYGRYINRN